MDDRRQRRLRRSTGLAVPLLGLLLAAGAAQADPISPGAIAAAPALTPLAQGSTVDPAGVVSGQYQVVGLHFSGRTLQGGTTGTAVINLGGLNVFAPTFEPAGGSTTIAYGGLVFGDLLLPGTTSPATTNQLQVHFASTQAGVGLVEAFDANGKFLALSAVQGIGGGNDVVVVNAPGIRSFTAALLSGSGGFPGLSSDPTTDPGFAWGVSSFDPGKTAAVAPEPGSLSLAAFGLVGLAGYRLRRRRP